MAVSVAEPVGDVLELVDEHLGGALASRCASVAGEHEVEVVADQVEFVRDGSTPGFGGDVLCGRQPGFGAWLLGRTSARGTEPFVQACLRFGVAPCLSLFAQRSVVQGLLPVDAGHSAGRYRPRPGARPLSELPVVSAWRCPLKMCSLPVGQVRVGQQSGVKACVPGCAAVGEPGCSGHADERVELVRWQRRVHCPLGVVPGCVGHSVPGMHIAVLEGESDEFGIGASSEDFPRGGFAGDADCLTDGAVGCVRVSGYAGQRLPQTGQVDGRSELVWVAGFA